MITLVILTFENIHHSQLSSLVSPVKERNGEDSQKKITQNLRIEDEGKSDNLVDDAPKSVLQDSAICIVDSIENSLHNQVNSIINSFISLDDTDKEDQEKSLIFVNENKPVKEP